jgi:hypothetical protein
LDPAGLHRPYATRVGREDEEEEDVLVVVAEELELDKELDMDAIPTFGQQVDPTSFAMREN